MTDTNPHTHDLRMGLAVGLTLLAFLTAGFSLGFTAASQNAVYSLGVIPGLAMIVAAHLLARGVQQ